MRDFYFPIDFSFPFIYNISMEEFKIPFDGINNLNLAEKDISNLKNFINSNAEYINNEDWEKFFNNYLDIIDKDPGFLYIPILPLFLLYIGIEFRDKVDLIKISKKRPLFQFNDNYEDYSYFGTYNK